MMISFEYAQVDPRLALRPQTQCLSAAIIIVLLYKNTQIFTTDPHKAMGR